MASVVHVTGFDPEHVLEDELRAYFEQIGAVQEVELLPTRRTGRGRGRAKVTFEAPAAATQAVAELEQIMYTAAMDAFTLRVKPFTAAPELSAQEPFVPALEPFAIPSELKLFVSWPKSETWSEADLRAVFAPHGSIYKIVTNGKANHFAKVGLTLPTRELAAKVHASSRAHPASHEHEGRRCWLQPWERPGAPISREAAAASQPTGGAGRGGGGGGGAPAESAVAVAARAVLCTHFPFEATSDEVRAECERVVDAVESV